MRSFFGLMGTSPTTVSGEITLVGTASEGSGTSITLPGGMQEGDIVIFAVSDSTAVTTPSGYTVVYSETSVRIAYKVMGATPDSSISGYSGTGTSSAAVAAVFRGMDSVSPVSGTSTATGTNPASLSASTGDWVITVLTRALGNSNETISSVPTGYTSAVTEYGSLKGEITNGLVANISYKEITSTGTEDPSGYTISDGSGCDVATIGLAL